jgi:hypothetical protein
MERLLVDTNPERQGQTQPAARARSTWSLLGIVALLGAVALVPRVLGLGDFATTDEVYHWIARTERFADAVAGQRWAETNQTGHPGVTLMWLGSLGLALERFAVGQGWASIHSSVEHLAWLRLPAALLQALLVPAGYLLLRRLLAPATALIAALLWATAPYLIAHARLLHLDGLLTSFVIFSLLLLLTRRQDSGDRTPETGLRRSSLASPISRPDDAAVGGRWSVVGGRWSVVGGRWSVVGSGICAGLALLTKGPALILLPFAGLLLFALTTTDDGRRTTDNSQGALEAKGTASARSRSSLVSRLLSLVFRRLRAAVLLYLLWLSVALLVVAMLWPALWVDPSRALGSYLEEIFSNGGRPNGDGQFFLGRAVGDPGPLFYPVVNLFRMTPVTLLGLLVLPLALRQPPRRQETGDRRQETGDLSSRWFGGRSSAEQRALLTLCAFVLFWTLVMTLGPKKFDRYVLPTWPAIEILAAAGLVAGVERLRRWGKVRFSADSTGARSRLTLRVPVLGSRFCGSLFFVLMSVNLAWYHPYYLSYYNPLLGGGAVAQRTLLIGWGEGMDQAGAWLRGQPDIGYGPLLSALGRTLQPFVPVLVRDVNDLGRTPANYAVVYLESAQRGANPPIYNAIQQTIPLQTITIHGIDYATIYQLPKPFERAVDARWGEALHLRGVTIAREPNRIIVTPAWDVRVAPAADYQVFLHLLDMQGQRVAALDVAPGGADFPPTSAWQPGRQIAVPLPLELPPDLAPGTYRLMLGIYEAMGGVRPPLAVGQAADPALDGPEVLLLDTIALP